MLSGKAKASAGVAAALSVPQRAMIEVERENAIQRYREMKKRETKEGDQTTYRVRGVLED